MGLFDNPFGETERLEPRDIRSPSQIRSFEGITSAAGGKAEAFLRSAGRPLPGRPDIPTPLTGSQQGLLSSIPGLISGQDFTQNPLFQQGVDVLSRTAEGFDPFKDTRLKAFKVSLEKELKRAKDRIAARTSAGDKFFGGGRLDQERELEESAFSDIGTLAAQLEAQSRQQAINAVPGLVNLASLEQNVPFDFFEKQLSLAGLPREFQEMFRLAKLQEELRRRNEQAGTVGPALETSMFSPPLAFDVFSSTPGLLGGPSGLSSSSTGGINRDVLAAQAGLSFLGGGGTDQLAGLFSGVNPSSLSSISGRTGSGGFTFG